MEIVRLGEGWRSEDGTNARQAHPAGAAFITLPSVLHAYILIYKSIIFSYISISTI